MKTTETQSPGSVQRLVGPCADVEQRIKDLYIVNTVAGWAQNNLRVLAEMAADHKLPDWYVSEVKRIGGEIETVASREAARRPNDPKLSDGGGWRSPCAGAGGWGRRRWEAWAVTAGAVRCSAWLGAFVMWKTFVP